MAATREQERNALKRIRKIVESLGENSYVATAFDGAFEIAENNIEDDFANSVADLKICLNVKNRRLIELYNEVEKLKAEVNRLENRLDKELEWKPYTGRNSVSQEDYEHLASDNTSRFLSEAEAKEILYNWFGFAKEKVRIFDKINTYEINRHGVLRQVGTVERKPVYNASDWFYIRFDCGDVSYEAYNGDIDFVNSLFSD